MIHKTIRSEDLYYDSKFRIAQCERCKKWNNSNRRICRQCGANIWQQIRNPLLPIK